MSESHDPMCQVPLSYLTMLQDRKDAVRPTYTTIQPTQENFDTLAAIEAGVTPQSYETVKAERDRAIAERDAFANQIAEFEFRAGCALAQIPVEQLGKAQDAYVSQQAIDTLKAENAKLVKAINETTSELCDWRGKYKEAQRKLAGGGEAERYEAKVAPYGFKKDGTPRKRPGSPARKARRAA